MGPHADPTRIRVDRRGRRRRALGGLLVVGAAALIAGCDAAPRTPGALAPVDVPRPSPAPRPLERVELVTGGARAEDALPLVVAVHGVGDTPQGLAALYRDFPAPARVVLPRGPDAYRGGASWFPLPWDAGRTPFVEGIAGAADRLAELLETLPRERPTRGRPILTGFSQGGILTFAVATRRPDAVSAALPLAGWLPEELWPRSLPPGASALPIRALHGGDDGLLPPEPTRLLVSSLRATGFDAELRVYPGVGHTLTREMVRDYYSALGEAVRREAARGAAPAERGERGDGAAAPGAARGARASAEGAAPPIAP